MSKHDETSKTPQPTGDMETLKKRDDALFEALGRSRKQKKRRIITTVAVILLVAVLVLVSAVSIMQRRVRERFASFDTDVLSHVVQTGTISTVVSGSGILTNVDAETLTVPEGVELTEILIENGGTVDEGQLLAIADMATVRTAMSDLQEEIEDLDDDIADADGDKASTAVTAGVPGRVKVLYGEPGMRVADVMVEHGALAVISLDGYMALDLETDVLAEGDAVTITRGSGEEITGITESVIDGTAVILVTDDGTENGETVTVTAEDGSLLGQGSLYVHNPLMVTAYAGTIRTVHVKENAAVSKNMYLFTLQDTEYSANYDSLLRSRREAEETLLELLKIQKAGGITAPVSGSVYSVADLDSGETITDLAILSPDVEMSVTISVDESDILSLALGQETNVTVSSVSEDVLTGIVTEIDKTASDGAYTAVVTLSKLEGMLPGMTADVDVKIQGVENALLVPADALHYTSTGAFVYTTYDAETQEYGGRVDVVTGLEGSDYVEVISGLRAGDTVWYTESQDFFDMFSAMGGMGGRGQMGGMPGGMPSGDFGGGDFGGSRGEMPAMPAGGMPNRQG